MVSRFYYRYSLSICEKKTRTNISSYDYLSAYWLLTGTHCNYQVTRNDCAWNEYIKKNLEGVRVLRGEGVEGVVRVRVLRVRVRVLRVLRVRVLRVG